MDGRSGRLRFLCLSAREWLGAIYIASSFEVMVCAFGGGAARAEAMAKRTIRTLGQDIGTLLPPLQPVSIRMSAGNRQSGNWDLAWQTVEKTPIVNRLARLRRVATIAT